MKDPPNALIEPSLPSVWAAPAPLMTAPRMTNIVQTVAAVAKLTMRVPTAVPNTFAASLAPSDHPRKRPLVRNRRTTTSIGRRFLCQTLRLMVWIASESAMSSASFASSSMRSVK